MRCILWIFRWMLPHRWQEQDDPVFLVPLTGQRGSIHEVPPLLEICH